MKLIAGLGNPGKEYEKTRHNSGFLAMDYLCRNLGTDITTEKWDALIAKTVIHGESVILMKPLTYMNESGKAVAQAVHFYHIDPSDILILHDDMDLPAGSVRIRKNGSSGGHNGIKSIISNLVTDAFPRFRLGIGHPVHEQQAVISHVLQRFAGDDKQVIEEAVKKMADALELWLKEGGNLDKVMQQFNTKPAKAKKRAVKEVEQENKHKEMPQGEDISKPSETIA